MFVICLVSVKSLKLFIPSILFLFSFTSYCHAQQRDFGITGILGLSTIQLVNLSKGEIVFLNIGKKQADGKSSLTEAVIVFSSSPETTWKLLSKTEDQPKYVEGCIEINVLRKSAGKAYQVHKVGNKLATFTYGVIQNFQPESKCFYWTLDSSYAKNDLNILKGYWQFYPYGNGQTLARYGSYISFKNIPEFIEKKFLKSNIKDALVSIKKYVDSGGTYRK